MLPGGIGEPHRSSGAGACTCGAVGVACGSPITPGWAGGSSWEIDGGPAAGDWCAIAEATDLCDGLCSGSGAPGAPCGEAFPTMCCN